MMKKLLSLFLALSLALGCLAAFAEEESLTPADALGCMDSGFTWLGDEWLLVNSRNVTSMKYRYLLNMKTGAVQKVKPDSFIVKSAEKVYLISDYDTACLSDGRTLIDPDKWYDEYPDVPHCDRLIKIDDAPIVWKGQLVQSVSRRFTLSNFRFSGREDWENQRGSDGDIEGRYYMSGGFGYLDMYTGRTLHPECSFVSTASGALILNGYAFANREKNDKSQAVVVRLSDNVVLRAFDGEWAEWNYDARNLEIFSDYTGMVMDGSNLVIVNWKTGKELYRLAAQESFVRHIRNGLWSISNDEESVYLDATTGKCCDSKPVDSMEQALAEKGIRVSGITADGYYISFLPNETYHPYMNIFSPTGELLTQCLQVSNAVWTSLTDCFIGDVPMFFSSKDSIRSCASDILRVWCGNTNGAMTAEKGMILPPVFDEVKVIRSTGAVCKKGDSWYFYDMNGTLLYAFNTDGTAATAIDLDAAFTTLGYVKSGKTWTLPLSVIPPRAEE